MSSIKMIIKRDLDIDTLNRISQLFVDGFPHDSLELWKKRLTLCWMSNPYVNNDTVLGWGLYNDENHLSGIVGWIPVVFDYGGRKLLVSATSAWYVNSKEQGIHSASLIQKYNLQKNVDGLLCTTPSPTVQKMLIAMKFQKIGPENLINYIIIINSKKFCRFASDLLKRFSEREMGLNRIFLSFASVICNGISYLIPNIPSIKQQYSENQNYYLIKCESSDIFQYYLNKHTHPLSIEFSKDVTTLTWILFSKEVQDLLSRKVELLYTKDKEYLGYVIYDYQQVGPERVLRIRELQLLDPSDNAISFLLKHLKTEAKNAGCAAVYSGLQNPDMNINKLLRRHIRISIKTENRYYIKFNKNSVTDVNPYAIYVPSDLDPDAGFL